MPKVIDTAAYLDTVSALLAAGERKVPVVVSGMSMTPFLDHGDTVFLDPMPPRPEPGDVILFRRVSGAYVLHRVVAVQGDVLTLLGDAQTATETIAIAQARGIVTAARHADRLLDERSLRWKFFRGPWRYLRRSRNPINRLRNHVRRKLHIGPME